MPYYISESQRPAADLCVGERRGVLRNRQSKCKSRILQPRLSFRLWRRKDARCGCGAAGPPLVLFFSSIAMLGMRLRSGVHEPCPERPWKCGADAALAEGGLVDGERSFSRIAERIGFFGHWAAAMEAEDGEPWRAEERRGCGDERRDGLAAAAKPCPWRTASHDVITPSPALGGRPLPPRATHTTSTEALMSVPAISASDTAVEE